MQNAKFKDLPPMISFEGGTIMNGEDFKRLEQIIVNFKEDVKAELRHQIGIQSEHFQHKLDIVVEGHEGLHKEIRDTREELCEKIKLVDFKLETMNETMNEKIDAVAADLSAHRADTEVHKKVYKVKED
jgi:hypothetical protein